MLTIFAPTSWPSRPGFPISTLTGLCLLIFYPPFNPIAAERLTPASGLKYGRLFEFSEDFTKHACHFPDRGIGLHRLQRGRHDVGAARRSFPQVLQTLLDLGMIALFPDTG